jgi:hypothetical protein
MLFSNVITVECKYPETAIVGFVLLTFPKAPMPRVLPRRYCPSTIGTLSIADQSLRRSYLLYTSSKCVIYILTVCLLLKPETTGTSQSDVTNQRYTLKGDLTEELTLCLVNAFNATLHSALARQIF